MGVRAHSANSADSEAEYGFPIEARWTTYGRLSVLQSPEMNNEGNSLFMRLRKPLDSKRQLEWTLGATAFPPGSIVFAKIGAAVFLDEANLVAIYLHGQQYDGLRAEKPRYAIARSFKSVLALRT